jgi:hypothetical protein
MLGGRTAPSAERLLSVADARAKGAAETVLLLLDDDPLSASRQGKKMSRWASPRLFERLFALDALRKLRPCANCAAATR